MRWAVAVALGVFLAGALVLWLRPSGSVTLLHVGYSDQGNGTRDMIFCLTNGTRKPIAYAGYSNGEPVWYMSLKPDSGWTDPNAIVGMGGGLDLKFCVLRPGQSVVFHGCPPPGLGAWRAEVTYWHCKVRNPQPASSGKMPAGSDAPTSIRGVDVYPLLGSGVERERTLMRGLQARLPKVAPVRLKRYVDSKASDPVAAGPEMN